MNVRFACLRRTVAVLLPALTLAGTPSLYAADETADAKPAGKESATEKKEAAERRGPLPFYFGRVVAPDQKGSW